MRKFLVWCMAAIALLVIAAGFGCSDHPMSVDQTVVVRTSTDNACLTCHSHCERDDKGD